MKALTREDAGVRGGSLRPWLRALEATAPIAASPRRTFPVVVEELAERFGDAPALLSDDETLSFAALARRSNRYSRWALEAGVAGGETIALLMPNRPEFLAVWIGITRVGGVVALLNGNLRGAALAHAITVANPGHLLVDERAIEALDGALLPGRPGPRVWRIAAPGSSAAPGAQSLDAALAQVADGPLAPDERPAVTLADRALLIYTSGTTGLPKAAVVSHRRILTWSLWFAGLAGTGPGDRMYDCLPLYHSVGGIVAVGSVLVSGGSVVIRDRFSAREFWDDIVRWDCTLVQYIGELCRYLLAAPPGAAETAHRLRLCLGNGLRADVWSAFQARFGIPRILEFYAATEGNFSLFNVEGKVGAIGRVPPFLAHRFPAAIVRFDAERGAPFRDARGCCIRCDRNEAGEAIGLISDGTARPSGAFEGYTGAAETDAKVLRDVFAPGDAWFRTGDLMRQDEQGFFYFVDRVGDTFRWKGENVSTEEVARVVAACPGVLDATVYGVAVPGAEGRAGMAAIVAGADFDLGRLHSHVAERLPAYARPLFLRLQADMAVTDTFKHKKADLVRDGFDPARVADPLFVDDKGANAYVALDAAGAELRL